MISSMRRSFASVLVFSLLLASAGRAIAQDVQAEESAGILLSEGLVFHPKGSVEGGYQSNVFYQDDADPGGEISAGILRFLAGASISTLPASRLGDGPRARQKIAFDADLELTWNQYLSDQDAVLDHSDLGIGALVDLRINPEGDLTFQLRDGFTRAVQPPPAISTQDVDRDKNVLTAAAKWRPGGGAIEGEASYNFVIDVFERSELDFANRTSHLFGLATRWQWLPKTQFSLEGQLGLVDTDETYKPGSMPLKVWLGAATLLTPTFGVIVRGGYGNSFHDTGESFSNYLAQVEGRYAVGPTLRTAFGYQHDFADALIGNFYADHTLYARAAAQLAGRWLLQGRGEVRFRDYGGIPPTALGVEFCGDTACTTSERSDVLGRLEASARYSVRDWLILGAAYTFNSVGTDFLIRAAGVADSAGYVWHEVTGMVSVTY